MTQESVRVNLEEAKTKHFVSGLQIVEKVMGINDAQEEDFDAIKLRLAAKSLARSFNQSKTFVEEISEELNARVESLTDNPNWATKFAVINTNSLLFDTLCDFTKLVDELENFLFGLTPEKLRKLREQDHSEFIGVSDDDKECA